MRQRKGSCADKVLPFVVKIASFEWVSLLGICLSFYAASSVAYHQQHMNKLHELKLEAIRDALGQVDAVMQAFTFGDIVPDKGDPAMISRIRAAYNHLAVTCKGSSVVHRYMDVILCYEKVCREPALVLNRFRAAIREELGLDMLIERNDTLTWLAKVPKPQI